MKNTIASDCWKAAARMDATIMGDCYGPMRAKAAAKYEPRPQKQEKIPRNGTSLTWDELSVCTDDSETTAGADTEQKCIRHGDNRTGHYSYLRKQVRSVSNNAINGQP